MPKENGQFLEENIAAHFNVQISQGEAAIFGIVLAIQKHWKSSLQPSLSRSLQTGSFSMPVKRK